MHPANPGISTNTILLLVAIFLFSIMGCDTAARQAAVEKAQAQVRRIAADLDKKTTASGVYVRANEDEIKEIDPWDTPIQIDYSQGGVAEAVKVRSAGPDRRFHTDDDVVAQGMAANLKGIGEGIKNNAEETAARAAKGVVKGTIAGVRESVKEALPVRKNKSESADLGTGDAEQSRQPDTGKPDN